MAVCLQDTNQNTLTMNNVAGCFYILLGGLFLSLLIGLGDFLLKAKRDSIRYNVSAIADCSTD